MVRWRRLVLVHSARLTLDLRNACKQVKQKPGCVDVRLRLAAYYTGRLRRGLAVTVAATVPGDDHAVQRFGDDSAPGSRARVFDDEQVGNGECRPGSVSMRACGGVPMSHLEGSLKDRREVQQCAGHPLGFPAAHVCRWGRRGVRAAAR